MAITAPMSLPRPPPFTSIFKPRSHHSSRLLASHLTLSTTFSSRYAIHFQDPVGRNHQKKSNTLWITFATPEEVLPSDATPLDNSQQIVSTTGDEGVATVIQALLFVAFVALTILTIGVIYIAVQDFLGKRERDKFEKEEAAKEKNGKKKKVRASARPRGFGQKIDEDDDDDI
ncbi:PREDICTED: uncharacterized protein LOC18590648 [Theobroma cacao]|uniref:Uncharacterized protein LOC18590648 n=1 Tax=Theobroma cacao TaxID=3641 RepID=A0AB32UT22_THECC|nr:PREDICTED: uncharacterized protein LOC18590648 [Theobroma cacao]